MANLAEEMKVNTSLPFKKQQSDDPFAEGGPNPLKGIFKLMVLQGVHGWISKRKWRMPTKIMVFIMIFCYNIKYSSE